MIRRSAIVTSLGLVAATLAACASDPGGGKAGGVGVSDSGTDAATAGQAGSGGASNGSGDGGRIAAGGSGIAEAGLAPKDAAAEPAPVDAARDAVSERGAQCLGVSETCGATETCCEAYACRAGKCCVPNGVYSWCTNSSDCCSTSCILNQCTCVPLGYSCTGAGQCCSGFACQGGTCICPPDIRGCN